MYICRDGCSIFLRNGESELMMTLFEASALTVDIFELDNEEGTSGVVDVHGDNCDVVPLGLALKVNSIEIPDSAGVVNAEERAPFETEVETGMARVRRGGGCYFCDKGTNR